MHDQRDEKEEGEGSKHHVQHLLASTLDAAECREIGEALYGEAWSEGNATVSRAGLEGAVRLSGAVAYSIGVPRAVEAGVCLSPVWQIASLFF